MSAQERLTPEGFLIPQPHPQFEFPRDHGSHPRYKIEWWYVTGHLFTKEGRRFGYQATFFRQSAPPSPAQDQFPLFGHRQLYMALTDVASGTFLQQELLNRDGWNAGASTETLDLRQGDWFLRLSDSDSNRLQLRGGIRARVRFDLDLTPAKPLTVFGRDGVSRKAADPAAVSHYLTFTRLDTRGTLHLDEKSFEVTGHSWMDHEISSSQLGEGQSGWDWASLQLNDGREIMAYRMRRRDGTTDAHSTLAWVDQEGGLTHHGPDQFKWSAQGRWTSPATGAAYPLPARIETVDPASGEKAAFDLVPLVANQELTGGVGGIAYWEGACRVLDANGREVGSAYVELTGCAGDFASRFH